MEEAKSIWTAIVCILTNKDNMSAIGNLMAGLGTIALAFVAYKQLPKDAIIRRETLKEENRFQLAREAIRIFNHLKNDLEQVRSPFSFSSELEELKNISGDEEYIRKLKANTTGALIMLRLNKRAESLAEMNRIEPEFRAIFGETDAFQTMRKARHKVWVAATMIINGDPDTKHTPTIWAFGEQDKLTHQIDEAVKQVESICQPVLRGER